MLESKIQSDRIKEHESNGYWVLKIIKANKSGIPDLLLIDKTTGVASFEEVKSLAGRISDIQLLRARELRAFGCKVSFVTVNGVAVPEREIEMVEGF
jgi:hypothetical protein